MSVSSSGISLHTACSPEHAPPQVYKAAPVPGSAVSVTVDPEMKLAVQVVGQSMPDGTLVTLPSPARIATLTTAGNGGGAETAGRPDASDAAIAQPSTTSASVCLIYY